MKKSILHFYQVSSWQHEAFMLGDMYFAAKNVQIVSRAYCFSYKARTRDFPSLINRVFLEISSRKKLALDVTSSMCRGADRTRFYMDRIQNSDDAFCAQPENGLLVWFAKLVLKRTPVKHECYSFRDISNVPWTCTQCYCVIRKEFCFLLYFEIPDPSELDVDRLMSSFDVFA